LVPDWLSIRPTCRVPTRPRQPRSRQRGRPDAAPAELATAVAMLREMGMALWLPEAEGELAEAGR
jgi:hypothetical protein